MKQQGVMLIEALIGILIRNSIILVHEIQLESSDQPLRRVGLLVDLRVVRVRPLRELLPDLLINARLVRQFQIVNGREPERIAAAVRGEHVGTIVYAD